MASIKINHAHNKPIADVREIADSIALKLQSSYDVSANWNGDDCIDFKRQGMTGKLTISDSHVSVHLELGLLFSGFKPMLEKRIKEQLIEKLA